jgi:hypothetical protein
LHVEGGAAYEKPFGWVDLETMLKDNNAVRSNGWSIGTSDIDRLVPGKETSDGAVNFYIPLLQKFYPSATDLSTGNPLYYISDTFTFSEAFDWGNKAASTDPHAIRRFHRQLLKKMPHLFDALFWALPIHSDLPAHYSLVVVLHPGGRWEVVNEKLVGHPPTMVHLDPVPGCHPSVAIYEFLRLKLRDHHRQVAAAHAVDSDNAAFLRAQANVISNMAR